jgi:hypothetical protein
MKLTEPKTKTGKPLLGVTISYNANNSMHNRWFINVEKVTLEKLISVLGYSYKDQFRNAINKYGMINVMRKGLDKLRAEND